MLITIAGFWHVQHEFVEAERRILGRKDGELTALAGQLKEVHEWLGIAGYWLIGLHAAAGIAHHYVLRDNTLVRMLPGRRAN